MANSAQARKRARQAEKRRQQNASFRSTMRTSMKKVVKLIEAGDKPGAAEAYKAAVPVIDRAAGKGLMRGLLSCCDLGYSEAEALQLRWAKCRMS